jgi:hypothetical protein
VTERPAFAESRLAIITDESGSRGTDTHAAPLRAATPGVSEYPGR